MKNSTPDYKRIYRDMISEKYPALRSECESILQKDRLVMLDIVELNRIISPFENLIYNQKLRSYDETSIRLILDYQKEQRLNNTETARHFGLSRNTVSKWKKIFN